MSGERYVLDTSVLVQLLRWKEAGQRIERRFGLLSSSATTFISAVSLGEARALAQHCGWGAEKLAKLHALLLKLVAIDIRREPVVARYADIYAASRRAGRPMGQNDLWIAAATSAIDGQLLTMDRDFEHLDASLLRSTYIDPTPPKSA